MYQTAVGRHGDRTRTAESSAVRNRARYHCAVGYLMEIFKLVGTVSDTIINNYIERNSVPKKML